MWHSLHGNLMGNAQDICHQSGTKPNLVAKILATKFVFYQIVDMSLKIINLTLQLQCRFFQGQMS